MRPRRLRKLLFGAAILVAHAVRAADPQPYTVQFSSTGNAELNATLRASSQLESLRKSAPVSPFALVDRAQQDIERLRNALDSFGYYRARITVTINGHALGDPDVPNLLAALPKKQIATVAVHFDTGPLFHLRTVTVKGDVSQSALAAFGLKSGAPVVAAEVLAARQRLLSALEDQGHAFAAVSEPIAYEDAHLPVMDVVFTATPGPAYTVGSISFEGLKRVHAAFLLRQLKLHPGEPYSASAVERARATLLGLGVFAAVSVRLPPQAQVSATGLPLTFVTVERKRHAVDLNGEYSSDLGVIAGASWTDRNLFGSAEQLTLRADITGLGGNGTATNGLGYDAGAQLTKPDFLAVNQSLQFSLEALKQQLLAYDQVAATGGVTLNRRLSSVWSVSIGVSLEEEKDFQNEVIDCMRSLGLNETPRPAASWCHYTLLSFPLAARYDSTDLTNPLDDPRHGVRASISLSPTESLFETHAAFLIMQANVSTYLDLAGLGWSASGRSVLALRALAAQARGAGQFSLPPDLRFYAGGSATVRGYAYQTVGPTFPPPDTPGEYPQGGTGLAAGTIEFRQRLGKNFGMAVFVDGGEVSTKAQPFAGAYSFGYGVGPRYYTPIGPIRIDVALPFRRLPNGDRFEAYVGLGQAF